MRISDLSSDVCSSDLSESKRHVGAFRSVPPTMPVFVVRSKGIVGFLGGRRQVAIGRSAWNGGFGVGRGRCRSSPFGGGGPCEAWWRGTRGVSCPLYVTRLRPCPSTTFGCAPPRSGEDRPPSVGR